MLNQSFCSNNISSSGKEPLCPFRLWPCEPAGGSTRTGGTGTELGSPESSLSPCSDLSVPSNPARSAQSLSSYNPFEDEDDTGSTVSEKEDIKAKKLVNNRFPLVSTSLALCLSVSPLSLSRLSPPWHSKRCMRPAGGGPAASWWTVSVFSISQGGGTPINNLWLLFLCPPLTLAEALAHHGRKTGVLGGPAGSLTAL